MSNSLFTEKLREHLVFTMAGLTLAALGTVGSLSLSYILAYHDTAQSQYRKDDYAFKEFFAKQPRALAGCRSWVPILCVSVVCKGWLVRFNSITTLAQRDAFEECRYECLESCICFGGYSLLWRMG